MSRTGSHIVLIGFMGSGKSTIGRLLAERLECPLLDMDEIITEREKMSITDIFEKKGEHYFRKIESQVLQEALNSHEPSVISTGGGAPCHLGGMAYILRKSDSFYLKVGRDRLLQRIVGDRSRPLVKNKTKQELQQFIHETLKKRETIYKRANHIVAAFDRPERIAERLIKRSHKKKV
ncbi:MAG: shikimate kinase [Bacteroidota bacterium]